jgi:hypothetical protein
MSLLVFRRGDVPHPANFINPAAKMKDAANSSATELSFQQQAIEEFHTRQVQVPHSIKISKRTISGTDNDSDDGTDRFPKRCVFVFLHRALSDSSSYSF